MKARVGRFFVQDLHDHINGSIPLERAAAREHLVQDQAESVNIDTAVGG
jgi:hypothetical protein